MKKNLSKILGPIILLTLIPQDPSLASDTIYRNHQPGGARRAYQEQVMRQNGPYLGEQISGWFKTHKPLRRFGSFLNNIMTGYGIDSSPLGKGPAVDPTDPIYNPTNPIGSPLR